MMKQKLAVASKSACIPTDLTELKFLENVGDMQLQVERYTWVVKRKPERTSLISSKIKSTQLEDSFLREIIPTEKDPTAVEKLWGIGKGAFKSRKEILEDAWVE